MAPARDTLEKKLGIQFKKKELLQEALTHRSYLNEHPASSHNERLEYLGDAVLELLISEHLFERFPEFAEGQMTVLRAALVNDQMLSKIAHAIDLGSYIRMSKGESQDKGRAREVILANAVEAVVGAIYLDQGIEKARKFVGTFILFHLDEVLKTKTYRDSKSELQEIIQGTKKVTPTYRVREESGPAHQRTFRVGVYINDECIGEGSGASKQEAELEAARNALSQYR